MPTEAVLAAHPEMNVAGTIALRNLAQLSGMLNRTFKKMASPHDIASVEALNVLELLADHADTMSPLDLAEKAMVTPGATSQILKKLEASGLITRTRDKDDGRRWHVEVSPLGSQRVESCRAAAFPEEARVSSVLTEEQLGQFTEAVAILQQHILAEQPWDRDMSHGKN
jgi:DNA-binding MarR family transcriptional regulator